MTTISQNGGSIYISQDVTSQIISYFGTTESGIINSFPITFVNTNPSLSNILIIQFSTDLILSNYNDNYLIIGSNYITIDGNSKTVSLVNIPNYPGLVNNIYGNIIIKNIGILNDSNTYLASYQGWIAQQYFGNGVSNIIEYCYSSGNIGKNDGSSVVCSGICGFVESSLTINNCYSKGNIYENSAGIATVKYLSGSTNVLTINNCYSLGNIYSSAGIVNNAGGYCYGNVTCNYCYTIGNMFESSGLFGQNFVTINANNCFSTGNMSNSGGIIGSLYNNGIANINNCYAIGNVFDTNSGTITNRQNNSIYSINIVNSYGSGISAPYGTETNIISYYNYNKDQWNNVSCNISSSAYIVSTDNIPWILQNISTPPFIYIQPISQSGISGSSITFTVVANGSDTLNYQWYLSGDAIEGAISSTYTISSITASGTYFVIISNTSGIIGSNSVFLTVN